MRGVEHRRGVISAEECERWVRGIYDARAHWTPNFEGVQFTLGRAYYTHLEEECADEYFAAARESDALVQRFVPGLQECMSALLEALAGAPVRQREGWCGPGVHIFPAGQWLSANGGDVHFDTEGLLDHEREARAPAKSIIVMLQPAARGGGLRVWDTLWGGEDEVEEPGAVASETIEYAAGDVVVIDSYRLHQIQPFEGDLDRISATAHLVQSHGRWWSWF